MRSSKVSLTLPPITKLRKIDQQEYTDHKTKTRSYLYSKGTFSIESPTNMNKSNQNESNMVHGFHVFRQN